MILRIITSIFLIILFAWTPVTAQEITFEATTDARQVMVGSAFTVSFTLQNANPESFEAPDFDGLKLLSGPSQMTRSTFINGVSTRSVGYTYTLQASRPGTYRIKPARARVNGKTLTTKMLTVEVVRQDPGIVSQDANEAEIYLVAEVDSTEAYIGQQIIIRYRIYTQVNIENYNILSESAYDGCYAQILDAYREPVVKIVKNGKEYSTKVLRKVSVFPQQSGLINIEPIVVRVGIPDRSQRRRSFFSNFNLKTRNISSNELNLEVKSPYENAPADFSGAVGHFNVRFRVQPPNASTDDAITLRMTLRGSGDVKTIREPSIDFPESFEIYEPKVHHERMVNVTDSVRSEKVIDYLFIARQPGSFEIHPTFTFLDPDLRRYQHVSDTFRLNISQGKGNGTASQMPHGQDDLNQLAPPKQGGSLRSVRSPLSTQPLYWASFSIPLLGFLIMVWRTKKAEQQEPETINHTEVAKARLEKAKSLKEMGESAFYEEIAFSIKNFISHKLDLPQADMTRQNVRDMLAGHGINSDVIDRMDKLLRESDYALYAGGASADKMDMVYDEAISLIAQLDIDLQ